MKFIEKKDMEKKDKTVYRSRIDWWMWCVIIFVVAVIYVMCISTYWWLSLIYGGGITLLFVLLVFGCWYEIKGDQLIVYQFFRPHRFPIMKIREVKKTVGYLATAGMSRLRVSIRFVDRSVMKSSMPLEISPLDRDAFIAQLKRINPAIVED